MLMSRVRAYFKWKNGRMEEWKNERMREFFFGPELMLLEGFLG
jgi:hypothetical protein